MFELPAEIRRLVYTTNILESPNYSLRKIRSRLFAEASRSTAVRSARYVAGHIPATVLGHHD